MHLNYFDDCYCYCYSGTDDDPTVLVERDAWQRKNSPGLYVIFFGADPTRVSV